MKNIYILGANSRLATHINKKFLKEFKIIRITRVAKKYGWKPQTNLSEGTLMTIEAYKKRFKILNYD